MKTTKAFRLQEVRQSHTARVYGRDRVCSLAFVLGSHFSSTMAMRATVVQLDDGKIDTEPVGGTSDRVLVWLNVLGGATFILGAFLAGVFVWYNLE